MNYNEIKAKIERLTEIRKEKDVLTKQKNQLLRRLDEKQTRAFRSNTAEV